MKMAKQSLFVYCIVGLLLLDTAVAAVCGFNPCRNGGVCTPQGNDFVCACPGGFTGIVCEARATTTTTTAMKMMTTTPAPATLPHPCDFNPCRNGGYCVATGQDYSCFCPAGSLGLLCEGHNSSYPAAVVSAAPCPFNPCKNYGFCVSAGQDYKCFCPSTHTGDYCENDLAIKPAMTTTRLPQQTTTIPAAAVETTSKTLSTTVSNICKVDILFILDSSGSVGTSNFQKQLDFVKDLSRSLFAGSHDLRIGVLTFSSSVHNQFYLNRYMNAQDIVRAIGNIPYDAGSTRTDLALQYARTNVFTSNHGDRADAPNVAIILTDGMSTDAKLTATQAELLLRANVKVIAVGIGSGAAVGELDLIAGDHGHVYTVSSFAALKNVQDDVLASACG